MAGRKLAGSVYLDGKWWRPGDTMPEEVAEKVTNPKVFAKDTIDEATGEPPAEPGAPSGPRLSRRVNVGGTWYGPDDPVPADVASRITNPKAWEGGKAPGGDAPAAATSTGDASAAGKADTAGPAAGPEPTNDNPGGPSDGAPVEDPAGFGDDAGKARRPRGRG